MDAKDYKQREILSLFHLLLFTWQILKAACCSRIYSSGNKVHVHLCYHMDGGIMF